MLLNIYFRNSNNFTTTGSVIKSTDCTQNSTSGVDTRISTQLDNEESTKSESEMNKSKSTKFQLSPHLEVTEV